MMSC
jgi:hypothetical protein